MVALPALLYALAVLAALALLYPLLRRALTGFRLPVGYALWVLSASVLTALVYGGVDPESLTWRLTAGICALLTVLVAFELIDAALIQRPWSPARPFFPRLGRDILRLALLIGAGLLAATVIFDVPLSTIIVSSTVLTAVIGLALQDVLRNLFAGMALDIDRPFARGDWLLLDDDTAAEVIEMGWRSVRLRTREGVRIAEPNSRIAGMRLVNLGAGRQPAAVGIRIALPFDTPPAEAKRLLANAAHSVAGTLDHPPVEVLLEDYGEHAVNYYLRAWMQGMSREVFRDALFTRVWYTLGRRGLHMPYPVQNVRLQSTRSETDAARRDTQDRAHRRLAQLELLHEVPGDAIAALAAGAVFLHYDGGENLVREGDTGSSLLVIDAGAAVATRDQDGAEVEVGRLQAGDFFGEYSLLTGEARSATVRAAGECVALEISRAQIAELLDADPNMAEILSRALAARRESAAASLQNHRARQQEQQQPRDQASVLRRIRALFGL